MLMPHSKYIDHIHNILTVPSIYIYNCLLFYKNNTSLFDQYINPTNYNTIQLGINNLMFPIHKLSSYERGYLYNVVRFTHICQYTETPYRQFAATLKKYLINRELYTVTDNS
ncbi:hypothetical protein O3M35_000399 [Rhynocoris fuscipes]|uniref:Uncharacterized protein n=1 Tax=Rhynocoris fuscipes TaxID=488301 RepID=A0AAW1DMF6_9HEMI